MLSSEPGAEVPPKLKIGSAIVTVVLSTVVDVPLTVKSPELLCVINGIQYIGGQYSPSDFIPNQASTIEGTQTVVNGVLAGPIVLPGTITVTGTLVIV